MSSGVYDATPCFLKDGRLSPSILQQDRPIVPLIASLLWLLTVKSCVPFCSRTIIMSIALAHFRFKLKHPVVRFFGIAAIVITMAVSKIGNIL